MKNLWNKYKESILYLFFGGCTTAVNTVVYHLLFEILSVPNLLSTLAAWAAAVLFAYVTNKVFVFESKTADKRALLMELVSFFACRLVTGGMDIAIMYVAVDLLHANGTLWKLLSNVVVIIVNYVASKLLIFKKR